MMASLFLSTAALLWLPAAAYIDINCTYPAQMPEPTKAYRDFTDHLAVAVALAAGTETLETPIVVRGAIHTNFCWQYCLAMHDGEALNPYTMERPTFVAPTEGWNAFSATLCGIQCSLSTPRHEGFAKELIEEWGLTGMFTYGPRYDVIIALSSAATDGGAAIGALLAAEDYHPALYGQLVMINYLNFLVSGEEGWNTDGSLTYDELTGKAVECTANCASYTDITGYKPQPPAKLTKKNRHECTGLCTRWQPLVEIDGSGNFKRQQHVTPQIGTTALHFLDRPYVQTPDPKYNYYKESLKVVERLRETASNETQKIRIRFFDDKLKVRGMIEEVLLREFGADKFSYEDFMLYNAGIAIAEYEAVLQSWNQKVKWDLVRPTTVIKRWGDDDLYTYGGDKTATEPVNIKARDFEVFQRTMPHSEYPSGSACICTAFAEYVNAWMMGEFGEIVEMPWAYGPGVGQRFCRYRASVGHEYALTEDQTFGCTDEDTAEFNDALDLAAQCGESRLWAGVHYTAAVPAGEESCIGIGKAAYEKMKKLRGTRRGRDRSGSEWFLNDTRPVCSSA